MMNNRREKYNQFRAMLAVSKASLQAMLKNPSAVIFTIFFPLVFIIAFGFIKGNSIKLEVGVNPQSDTSAVIYKMLSALPNIDLKKDKSLAEMEDLLNKGRMDAMINIYRQPKDNAQVIDIMTSKASREKGVFVKTLITSVVDKQNLAYMKQAGYADVKTNSEGLVPTELKESVIPGREYKTIDFILPGQLGFSILSAGVFGTAFIFFSLRQTLVLKRFFATPIRRGYIILGETLSRLVFQLIGSGIIIILGKYFFGFTLIHGFWTAIEMLALSALGLLVFMGFGFVISGIAKSESVIPPLANIITLPQFLLSGTFFPIDAFPGWLQVISKILPLTYLNDALRKIAFEGVGIADISHQILIITIWGVIAFVAAIRFFRWE